MPKVKVQASQGYRSDSVRPSTHRASPGLLLFRKDRMPSVETGPEGTVRRQLGAPALRPFPSSPAWHHQLIPKSDMPVTSREERSELRAAKVHDVKGARGLASSGTRERSGFLFPKVLHRKSRGSPAQLTDGPGDAASRPRDPRLWSFRGRRDLADVIK